MRDVRKIFLVIKTAQLYLVSNLHIAMIIYFLDRWIPLRKG